MKTPAERKAAETKRRKEAGETRFHAWVPREKLDEIKAAVHEILNRGDEKK